MVRDRPALLFLAAVPVVVITIIASALAGTDSGSLLLPVVNEDEGPVAELLLESLREHVDVVEVDRAEAERLVAGTKRSGAALVLPEHMSKRYLGDKESTLTLLTELKLSGRRLGLATACVGGGQGVALVLGAPNGA